MHKLYTAASILNGFFCGLLITVLLFSYIHKLIFYGHKPDLTFILLLVLLFVLPIMATYRGFCALKRPAQFNPPKDSIKLFFYRFGIVLLAISIFIIVYSIACIIYMAAHGAVQGPFHLLFVLAYIPFMVGAAFIESTKLSEVEHANL